MGRARGSWRAAWGARTRRSPRSRRPGRPRSACRCLAGSAAARLSAPTGLGWTAQGSAHPAARVWRAAPRGEPDTHRRRPPAVAARSEPCSAIAGGRLPTSHRVPSRSARGAEAACRSGGGRASDRRGDPHAHAPDHATPQAPEPAPRLPSDMSTLPFHRCGNQPAPYDARERRRSQLKRPAWAPVPILARAGRLPAIE